TVLRRGRVVGTTTPEAADEAELARMMVGRPVQLEVAKSAATVGEEVLQIRGITVRDDRQQVAVNDLDLTVRAGEIVAIAGVQGNGQTELVDAITGLRRVESGEIRIAGAPAQSDPRHVFAAGVGHVPEDRLEEGLVVGFSVAENMILNSYYLEPYSSGLALHRDAMLATATELAGEYDVRTTSVLNDIGNLSGGNQQKVIVAREFSRPLKLLVAAQPTRGLDVGSIEYIHKRIVAKRNEGTAVLIVSTELEEVLSLGDRIAVMFQGRIVDILDPSEATPERLGLLMGGAHPEEGIVPVTAGA
nr:ATP-binding cassette domain-containing protein [Chloroflexota bacterium]